MPCPMRICFSMSKSLQWWSGWQPIICTDDLCQQSRKAYITKWENSKIVWSWSYYVCFSCTTWWHHQMETFSVLLAICAGNSPVPVNSPHKGQWRGALMFSLICAWINSLVNDRGAGDLRRSHSHYDIHVMNYFMICNSWSASDISVTF